MSDILNTAVKAFVSVIVLYLLTRIMGKRQITQLTNFDYTVGISIGSIAAALAIDDSINFKTGITGLVVYALFPIILAFISLKSYRGRNFLDGVPTVLIQNGVIIEKNLNKTHLTINDLLVQCRLKNTFNISNIEYAILETNGDLSILLKPANQPVTAKDMNVQSTNTGISLSVVIDGKIIKESMDFINKDNEWLKNQLKLLNMNNISDVLLAYVDQSGKLYAHSKSSQIKKLDFC